MRHNLIEFLCALSELVDGTLSGLLGNGGAKQKEE